MLQPFKFHLLLAVLWVGSLSSCAESSETANCQINNESAYCQKMDSIVSVIRGMNGITDKEEYLQQCDLLLREAKAVNDTFYIISADYYRSFCLFRNGEFLETQMTLKPHLDVLEHKDFGPLKANLLELYGNALLDRRDYVKGIEFLKLAQLEKERIGDSSMLFKLYLDIAYADFRLNENYELANEYFEKGLKIVQAAENSKAQIYVYSNFATTIKEVYPDKALIYINKAIELSDEIPPDLLFTKGDILKELGRYQEALVSLDACEELAIKYDIIMGVIRVKAVKGQVHLATNNCQEGLRNIQSALDLSKDMQESDVEYLFEIKADLHECLNQYQLAKEARIKYYAIQEERYQENKANTQEYLEQKLEKVKVDYQYQLVQANLMSSEKNRFLQKVIIGVLFVLVLVTSFLSYKNKKLYRGLVISNDKLIEKYKLDLLDNGGGKISDDKSTNQNKELLEEYFKSQKPFLKSDLKTEEVCEALNLNYQELRNVLYLINPDGNFNNFVNIYRVEHAKKLLADTENNYLSIEGIALESGFGSRQTFYRVFEEVSGLKPKFFRTKIQDQV
jgi:AraC-like DNA-binding protein